MQIKSELRKQLILLRKTVDESKRREFSQKINKKLFDLKEFKECGKLFCYFGKKSEIPTEDIILKALQSGKRIALPKCVGNNMIFRYIKGFDDLEKGSFGVYEPKSGCEQALSDDRTLCITPALCYNCDGYRIGYGKGFYDRFFADNPCIKIGLCYEEFMREFDPQENDISVDIIVSENKVRIINSNTQKVNRKED